jgi:glutathione synthase/RimK-type ligase-like ATP-grasp enzyme
VRVALATCREFADLVEEERPLVGDLAALGVRAEPVCWDDAVDWGAYGAVVVRSVWDYWLRVPAFTAWLGDLERRGVPCWNPVPLIRWNLDKRYLRELETRGVPTVPTLWFDGASDAPEDVPARVAEAGWDDVVVKPTVSAGAWRTLRTRASDLASNGHHLRSILAGGGLMAQPFVPEVVTEGELSFVFFAGELSHAVRKRPGAGDFRVQWIHGGSHAAEAPSREHVAQARAALAAAPSEGLYARVDGVVRGGRLVLMELEMIEPYLFLTEAPGSRERFARAVAERVLR